jgi:hypothetical protein
MSVLVEFGENYFKPGTPTPLFETQFDSTGNWENYDERPTVKSSWFHSFWTLTRPSAIYNWPKLLEEGKLVQCLRHD